MELEKEVTATIRLTAKIESHSVISKGRSRRVYDAACGEVKVTAPSRAEAVAELSKAVADALESWGNPLILWSLDGRDAWIAFATPHGWGYTISDAGRAHCDPRFGGSMLFANGGTWATREECLEHMRSHWYDQNVGLIVDGILGLCTDQRQWVCGKCHGVSRSGAPYLCRNPACGAPAFAFAW